MRSTVVGVTPPTPTRMAIASRGGGERCCALLATQRLGGGRRGTTRGMCSRRARRLHMPRVVPRRPPPSRWVASKAQQRSPPPRLAIAIRVGVGGVTPTTVLRMLHGEGV